MKKLFILLMALVLYGCAANHQVIREDTPGDKVALNPQDDIGVMLARDGEGSVVGGEKKSYLGSGLTLSTRTISALMSKFESVSLVETIDFNRAIQISRDRNIEYLVIPLIEQWVDENNPWTLAPDRLALTVSVIKVTDMTKIRAFTYQAEDHSGDWTDYPVERMLGSEFQASLLQELAR